MRHLGRCAEDETGDDSGSLRRRRPSEGEGGEEEESEEIFRRQPGPCRDRQEEEGSEERKEESEQITAEEKEQEQKAEEIQFQSRLQGEPLQQRSQFVGQSGPPSEKEGTEGPWLGIPDARKSGGRTAVTGWCAGGGLHGQRRRQSPSKDVHIILPAGVEAGAGSEVSSREISLVARCLDLLREGRLAHLADTLAARLLAVETASKQGWGTAKYLEIYGADEEGPVPAHILLSAQRHQKQVERAGGKGSWPKASQWSWNEWGPDNRQKGKGKDGKGKGKKGKGKGKSKGGAEAKGENEKPKTGET